jgi:hypothetical protein
MSGTTPGAPMGVPVVIVDNFLPFDLATGMRADIEAHFTEPHAHHPDTHQLWDYCFVPQLHTYLRTSPERIIHGDRIDAFMRTLQAWSIATLGMGNVAWPNLCLYVGGCRQTLHDNATAGRFGFVYSLTRNQRRTVGGEILVLREGEVRRRTSRSSLPGGRPFGGGASAEGGLYEVIEPMFNRLVVFDGRLPYAVELIEGAMDPIEGCVMLHGHLGETGTIVTGDLPNEVVEEALVALFRDFAERNSARIALYQGPLALRFVIGASGSVESCETLVDLVIHEDPRHSEWEPVRGDLVNRIRMLKFPPARGETVVTKPLILGVPLPDKV